MTLNTFFPFSLGFGLFLLLLFAVLQWFHIAAGSFLDWLIGGLSFEWLVLITTVPWNIYFQARQVLAEAEQSESAGISVATEKLSYATRLARRSRGVALALHLVSAIALYALAATGVSAIGYLGSGAALLLTGLRPAVRGYEYLTARLGAIQQELKYPREDVLALRDRLTQFETRLKTLEQQLDPEQPQSFMQQYQRFSQEIRRDVSQTQTALTRLRTDNASDHDRLSREAAQGLARLSEDSEFLHHARELIRFFKSA